MKTKQEYYKYREKELTDAKWWWGLLVYSLPFSLIPFFVFSDKNKFIYHHAKQGLFQFVFFIFSFLSILTPKVGDILLLFFLGLNFSFSVMGMIYYWRKEIYEFPIIGFLARMTRISYYDD